MWTYIEETKEISEIDRKSTKISLSAMMSRERKSYCVSIVVNVYLLKNKLRQIIQSQPKMSQSQVLGNPQTHRFVVRDV